MPWNDSLENFDRRLQQLERSHEHLLERIRDTEWECKLARESREKWVPVLETMKDQDYLRNWIAKQEEREQQEQERVSKTRWGRLVAIAAALAAWTGSIAALVAVLVRSSGHS